MSNIIAYWFYLVMCAVGAVAVLVCLLTGWHRMERSMRRSGVAIVAVSLAWVVFLLVRGPAPEKHNAIAPHSGVSP